MIVSLSTYRNSMNVRSFSGRDCTRKSTEKNGPRFTYDMMSSEESGNESEGQEECIIVKALPW